MGNNRKVYRMINKLILIVIFILSILLNGYLLFRESPDPEIISTIDTVLVQLPPDTVIKSHVITKYVNIYNTETDSTVINGLNDSLKVLDRYISELISQLIRGDVTALYDTTVFGSGDSLQTMVLCWPINEINYKFWPRPDKTIIITNTTANTRPTIIPSVGITGFSNALNVNAGIGVKSGHSVYSIEYGISNTGHNLGIKYGREFSIPRIPFIN